jgi:uncharacterized protein YndB with AHSA1/START domain
MRPVQYELAVERYIDAPPPVVFKVWTERLEDWWAPKPWTTKITELDLRPGGRSAMIMAGPDGASSPMEGVILEVVPNERIVFTNAFTLGWNPQHPFMVGLFTFAPDGAGTRYRAAARHWDEATQRQHEAMGFSHGWGIVAGQLAELAEAEAKGSL